MSISQALLPEFDHEMTTTRKVLERVPEDRYDWKPHPKSMPIGRLAGHIAELCGWGTATILQDELDFRPANGPTMEPLIATSRSQLLEAFDQNAKSSREAIAGASDETLLKTWRLLSGGHEIMAMPRIAVLRTFVMNHVIHHRGQLSVYLRLNDVAVPSIYGPSADENSFATAG